MTCQITWKPTITTDRLILRPVEPGDLENYQDLFKNATAMENVRGGVRDITRRFQGWVDRWDMHSYSAFAIVDKVSKKFIGHVVLGHGDYEGDFEKGWSEIAIVIDPKKWNKGLGTEAIKAMIAFARALKKEGKGVPSDVTEEQLEELKGDLPVPAHRNQEGRIQWVVLPLTKIIATASRENTASHRLFTKQFVKENGGTVEKVDELRDRFTLVL